MPLNSTEQVLGIHIKSDKPQPCINSYTWELLLTAVVGLHIVKFLPSAVKEVKYFHKGIFKKEEFNCNFFFLKYY
jgi:hypothetical protein